MGEVIVADIQTRHDLPVSRILDAAKAYGLDGVVICGFKDENVYFATSYGYLPDTLWALEACKHELMKAEPSE